MKKSLMAVTAAVALGIMALCAAPAAAVNILQVYIPSAVYDAATQTWVVDDPNFELWVVGNTQFGTIEDVMLSAALLPGETGTVTLTAMAGTTDPTGQTLFFGTPLMGDGDPIPTHGIYPASYFQWQLGDFAGTTTPILDYVEGGTATGQINKYQVAITGFTTVHFDAYDHYFKDTGDAMYKVAPLSHDGETRVPEPGTLLLLGTGLLGLGLLHRRQG